VAYIPEQGDIVWLNFDPSSGKEIMKRRPAYVLSRRAFNEHTGLALIAPITSTIRGIKLEVGLPQGLQTKGSIVVYQLKSLDFNERDIKFIESLKESDIKKIKQLASLLIA